MKVNICIETSSTYQGITDRKCSYVLSVSIRNEERTREGFGHFEGTWHQAVLVTLAEALERMTVPCEICVHTRDAYVCSRISKLEDLAGSGWKYSKGELIKNAEEWQRVYSAIHALPEAHKLTGISGKHSYSEWLREEMAKRDFGRIMGQRLELTARSGPTNNARTGYHY